MDTPENNNNPATPENIKGSLLEQIIQTANESSKQKEDNIDTSVLWGMSIGPTPVENNSNITPPIRKPRDPLTTGTVLKLIWSLLLVAIIFFGSFLAYIVFNPENASFFVNTFNITPSAVQQLLKDLIKYIFSIIEFIFAGLFIISLFRAIWTPKEQKRRRLVNWLIASIFGILFFGILGFWAFLFQTINATSYDNLGGDVTIYDNDLYIHNESRQYARVQTTNNIIGPITLKYDLSSNVKSISKKSLVTIESYDMDFDGAKCVNEKSTMNGSNPLTEQGLVCTFDQVRTYNVRWSYKGKDRLGASINIPMQLNTVEVKWVIDITTTINKDKKKVVTMNALKVKNLWNPRWSYPDRWGSEKIQNSITEEVTSTPLLVCLSIFDNSCDRLFILTDTDISASAIEGSILFNQDPTNSLDVTMTLSGVNISNNEIVNIDWIDGGGSRLCQWTSEKCSYIFTSYGSKNIIATITLANKKTYTIQWMITLNKPLLIMQHAKVLDQDNVLLNTDDTFDTSVGSYIIKNISVPTKLTLDARDIVLENSGYKIRNVLWRISTNKTTEEKVWEKVIFELPQTIRYTIEAIYTFEKNGATNNNENFTAKDTIIVDLEHKPLEPILNIQQSSDYAPVKITVDASSSQSKNGTIQKFIFDFEEWRPPAEGDAIQVYEYRIPGQKKITLTIIDNDNETATTSKYIILKDTPKNLGFNTSMSPWVINTPVDFIADGTTGSIEEWIWNFGDNTPVQKWYEVTHTYIKNGTYTVTMTVRYMDGTEKSTNKTFQVDTSLE